MAQGLMWLTIAAVLALFALLAWSRYRKHQRIAERRSRAALNRLLADADEIVQRARQDKDGSPGAAEQQPPAPEGHGGTGPVTP